MRSRKNLKVCEIPHHQLWLIPSLKMLTFPNKVAPIHMEDTEKGLRTVLSATLTKVYP